jgi:diguanylate cyclase (GGDEF)-like protein
MYMVAVLLLPQASMALMISILITLMATVVFTLWGAYRMEHSARTVWLRARLDGQLKARLQTSIDQYASMARYDALTGLPNRRQAQRQLQQLWARASHDGAPLTVLLMDVDHFKRYNDHHGHPAGDACLQRVAQALAGELQGASEFVARWGGEEFLAVLVGHDADQVSARATRVVNAVAALQLPHGASLTAPVVTTSLGVATAWPARAQVTPESLIQQADEALYLAKSRGRNRWAQATVPMPASTALRPGAHIQEAQPDATQAPGPDELVSAHAQTDVSAELTRLQRVWAWPHFGRVMEARFWRDRAPARADHFLLTGVIALFVFNLFLPVDHLLANDVWREALRLRLQVFTPFWAAIIAACWAFKRQLLAHVHPLVHEALVLGSVVLAGACLSYVLAVSRSPLVQYYHVGLMVVMLYGNLVQRLRFWFAAVASAVIVGMHIHGALTAPGIDPRLMLPMIILLAFSGVFSLMSNHAIDCDDRRVYLLELRSQATLAALDDAEVQVRRLARIDPLTGLYNRRHLDDALANWVAAPASARAGGEGRAVIMIDVDHFKRFNDRHGHQEGDRCLRAVAQALSDGIREPSDFVARVGGEEFVAVLCTPSASAALRVAERMRQALLAMAMPHGDSPTAPCVTASLGVVWVGAGEGTAPATWLQQADEALYEAKRLGRNRVHLAGQAQEAAWPERAEAPLARACG